MKRHWSLAAVAHATGLKVHAWALRRENAFLQPVLRAGSEPGMTGVFTDNPGDVAGGR